MGHLTYETSNTAAIALLAITAAASKPLPTSKLAATDSAVTNEPVVVLVECFTAEYEVGEGGKVYLLSS